jgi:imidazolonepropionase-like amidohydrolase
MLRARGRPPAQYNAGAESRVNATVTIEPYEEIAIHTGWYAGANGAWVSGAAPLAFICLSIALTAQAPRSGAGAMIFDGARLITGDGRVIERSAFVIDAGRFAGVGAQGQVAIPPGARRVDLTGKTVMPALVDAHTHLGYRKDGTFLAENFTHETLQYELEQFASFGVGAVASAGTDRGDLTLQLRGEPAPRHAGIVVRTAWRGLAPPDAGPNPPMRAAPYGVSTEEEARRDVRELAAKKADFVKIWVDDRSGTVPKLSPPLYRAIIDEAHKNDLRVFAHIATLADAKDLLRSGIDGFLHVMRDRPVDDELLTLLAERPQVFFTMTLFGPSQAKGEDWPRLLQNIGRLNAAGVRLALGTDVGGASAGGRFGWTEHAELEYMVTAGLTPAQAITAATRTAAEVLRLAELGTIAAKKSASFIVLDANALEQISNTQRIARVYLHGEEVRARRTSQEAR